MYRIVMAQRPDGMDVAKLEWTGREHEAASRHGASMAVARMAVNAGAPDGPWQAVGASGDVRFGGRSLHGLARLTITETDRIRKIVEWAPYAPTAEAA